jgi:hypothetical protein
VTKQKMADDRICQRISRQIAVESGESAKKSDITLRYFLYTGTLSTFYWPFHKRIPPGPLIQELKEKMYDLS